MENFTFVFALDDKVIERGIGHRYKDYAFGNKISEMPITSFEYLEKIVHLPFRLPALTHADALRFLKRKERALSRLKAPHDPNARHWFAPVQIDVDARTPHQASMSDATDMSPASDRAADEKRHTTQNKIGPNLVFSCEKMCIQNSVASSCVSLQVLAIYRYCVELAPNARRTTKFLIAHIFATNH